MKRQWVNEIVVAKYSKHLCYHFQSAQVLLIVSKWSGVKGRVPAEDRVWFYPMESTLVAESSIDQLGLQACHAIYTVINHVHVECGTCYM